MNVQISCSNCGHRSRKYAISQTRRSDAPAAIVKCGWDSFGDAFYCPACVKTWGKRNGQDRPLWGPSHTKQRVYQVIIGQLLDQIQYDETGEWPC